MPIGLFQGSSCKTKARLDGKIVAITGANAGIGKETAKELAARGAEIIMLCRDVGKANAVAEEIKKENIESVVTVIQLDLASLESVREAANKLKEKEQALHILINNAGIMTCPEWKTKDGFEMQFGTNHLGHFLLTLLCIDLLKASSPSRIINLSSSAHTGGSMNWDNLNLHGSYSAVTAYCQSKLANILFTNELARRLEGTGVTTYAVHPGVVKTELGRHVGDTWNSFLQSAFNAVGGVFFKTAKNGAQTSIYCSVAEELEGVSGKYYSDCKETAPSRKAQNMEDAKKLWDVSLKLVGLENYDL